MPPRSRFAVVLNGAAGTVRANGAEAMTRLVERTLGGAGHDATVEVASPGDVDEAVRRACLSGADVVVAGGGDGTVSRAAQLAAEHGVTLGVLPVGTLNLFARDLNMPRDPELALQALATGATTTIDLGEVNGRSFLIHASLGVYPWVVRRREQRERHEGYGRWAATASVGLKALFRYPTVRAELEYDGLTQRVRTPLIMVSNNPITDGPFLQRARLDGGTLMLYLGKRGGVTGVLNLAFDAALGWWHENQALRAIGVRALTIRSSHKRLPIAIDGEVESMATPLRYKCRPRALRVVVPTAA
jgi:diacylglycerol kinase family enzyme